MQISVDGVVLPNKPLSNLEILDVARKISIPGFRGAFVRNRLPNKVNKNECGILNLDDYYGSGTHWVAWFKRGEEKYYFDSYGVQPPGELMRYLKSPVVYNNERFQPTNEVFCGHLCLYVPKELLLSKRFQDVINCLY